MDDAIAQQQKQQETLRALQEQLEQAQQEEAQEQAAQKAAGEDLVFGMTPAALIIGLVVSTLGLALLRYARVTVQWSVAVVGVALMTVPFFVTDAIALGVIAVVVVAGLLLLRRLSGSSSD